MQKYIPFLPLLILLPSCATIVNGTIQDIAISTCPTQANVFVDGYFMGTSPLIALMSRKNNHVVRIELEGFETREMIFQQKISGWVCGNLVFGGFIGVVIDACTGGIYTLTPDQVNIQMQRESLACTKKSDTSYVAVVLEADPSWTKIDNLTPLNN